MNVNGKVSWFGGPGDPTDSGHTANGETTKTPGIAIYNHGTLGGYWRVRAPNGRTVVVKQTDIGPAPWTGRKIDVTYSAVGKFGYGTNNFPTNSEFKAEYLGHNPRAAQQAQAPIPQIPRGKPAEAPQAPSQPTFNRAAFQKASSDATVGKLLQGVGNSQALVNLLGTREPQRSEYMEPATPEAHILNQGTHSTFVPPGTNVTNLKGVAEFGGHKVASWIAPILKYAQAHGWHGTVSSGFRSFAEQKRIYDSGVRPAAVPGSSNHEGSEFPRGAVDVTQAEELSKILKGSPYASALQWAGSKDAVHFSHPHGGSY